jgi:DNA-binding PadR family transcriptional regulator
MAKTNKTHYAILGMLSIAPMSGYEIRQTMQQSTANFWSESDGQLYPALTKLTKLGLVLCKADKTSAREKKVYHITTKGITELNQWLAQEPETHIIRNEFMLKLFFGANVSPEINLEHIQAHRYQTKKMLSQLAETKKQLEHKHKDSSHLPYWQMSIQYGITHGEAKLKWCDDVIHKLKKMNRGGKS